MINQVETGQLHMSLTAESSFGPAGPDGEGQARKCAANLRSLAATKKILGST